LGRTLAGFPLTARVLLSIGAHYGRDDGHGRRVLARLRALAPTRRSTAPPNVRQDGWAACRGGMGRGRMAHLFPAGVRQCRDIYLQRMAGRIFLFWADDTMAGDTALHNSGPCLYVTTFFTSRCLCRNTTAVCGTLASFLLYIRPEYSPPPTERLLLISHLG